MGSQEMSHLNDRSAVYLEKGDANMRSKEVFYSKVVKELREIIKNPDNLKCSCPKQNVNGTVDARNVSQFIGISKIIFQTAFNSLLMKKYELLLKSVSLM
jgi:hypothetical protein